MFKKIRVGAIACMLLPMALWGQSNQNDLVGMPLEDAQSLLTKRGYEIAGSSLFKKEQLWYSENENNCISISF